MGYPSSVSGCGCDSGDSVASSGITGTAGCSGLNVPCIAVTNGVVTSLSDRTLSIPSGGGKYICFPSPLPTTRYTANIDASFDGIDVQSSVEPCTFWCPFAPTSTTLVTYCLSGANAGATYGFGVRWSTDGVSWNDLPGTLNLNNVTQQDVSLTQAVSVPGSPTWVYLRVFYKNTTGLNPLVALAYMHLVVTG